MAGKDDEATKYIQEIQPRGGSHSPGAGETRIAAQPKRDAGQAHGAGDQRQTIIHDSSSEGRTILHRPGASAQQPPMEAPAKAAPAPAPAADSFDPVTGWLVAIMGPGKGSAVPIFEGMNSVGRDPGQRIPLTFNDPEISREHHFFVTYERRKREFHISNGVKSNLVYLNGDVVLSQKLLAAGDEIEVGKTKLRFVPLCGPGFSWDEA